ncbi:BQ2448_3916 [Microbotryum intermedium]|uniref:BQ2448_3916 protein n=1 Tax=Microbotryum intermedium TaxID=269621 RepID=A0A238FHV7_9BASI|nr:BQ2448_3916 [Microbotryum intermedium]
MDSSPSHSKKQKLLPQSNATHDISPAAKKRKRDHPQAVEVRASSAAPPAETGRGETCKDVAQDQQNARHETKASPSANDGMTKVDKAKAKKRRKEVQKAMARPLPLSSGLWDVLLSLKRRDYFIFTQENPPSFAFDTRGFKGGRTIQIKDIRDFVLHLLSEEKAQQWLYVAASFNKRNVRRVVALMIPGITSTTLGVAAPPHSANLPFALSPPATPSQLPIFQTLFSHACPTKAPGDKYKLHSCYQHFINCPLTGGEKDRREKARKELGQSKKTADPSLYLMTPEQMAEQAYPVPSRSSSDRPTTSFDGWKRDDGWIEAPYQAPLQHGQIPEVLGIDCEMCLTEDGSELTRVSVVDMHGKSVYDSLVKPDKPILDYLTRFSGLDNEKLSNVTKRLGDVHRDLSKLISYNTVLIGHSLECDLRVLKLVHSFIIDTSVIYQHPRGPPFKASLKWLAQKWLKREIQNNASTTPASIVPLPSTSSSSSKDALAPLTASTGSDPSAPTPPSIGGHDSAEDALTCIDLLKLKMAKGPGFGEFQNDQETIFERLGRGTDRKRCAVVDHGTPGQWHGAKADSAIGCTNDDQVVEGVARSVEGHELVVGRFMDLSHALGCECCAPFHPRAVQNTNGLAQTSLQGSQPSNAALGKLSATLPGINVGSVPSTNTQDTSLSSPSPSLDEVHAQLNSQLLKLHASLPPLTALVIFTGHNSPLEMSCLAAKKAKFDRLWKTIKQSEIADEDRWMESDDRTLLDEVERCRTGLSFYCVK